MSEPDAAAELARERATRDAAKEVMLARYDALRDDFSPGALKDRAVEQLTGDARHAVAEAKAIAQENKAVLAGAAALAAGWLLRAPLTRLGKAGLRRARRLGEEPPSAWQRLLRWIKKEMPR